ncbi:MAG TPA: hydrogenase maturation nickel metallochaperone HypA [bacterium]|nr:hydrogenase maturation nickel metallochaperone HypA [bacterium]
MHELSITQEMVNVIEEARRSAGEGAAVLKVKIKIGALTGIVAECVEKYYEILTEDTLLSGAALEFTKVPVKIRCGDCDSMHEIDEAVFICDKCGSTNTEVITGQELFIESIEVSEPEKE